MRLLPLGAVLALVGLSACAPSGEARASGRVRLIVIRGDVRKMRSGVSAATLAATPRVHLSS